MQIQTINNKQNTSFCGLKPNIEESRIIMRDMKSGIGKYNSPTHMRARFYRCYHSKNFRYVEKNMFRYLDIINKHSYEGDRLWFQLTNALKEQMEKAGSIKIDDVPVYKNIMVDYVKKFRLATCGYLSDILQFEHFEKGIKTQKAVFKITDLKGQVIDDHAFLLRGLKKDANLEDKKTWGQGTIIIDPWLNFIGRALETPITTYKGNERIKGEHIPSPIDFILELLRFDPKTEKYTISPSNNPIAKAVLAQKTDLKK